MCATNKMWQFDAIKKIKNLQMRPFCNYTDEIVFEMLVDDIWLIRLIDASVVIEYVVHPEVLKLMQYILK